jgi:hypothetical protein
VGEVDRMTAHLPTGTGASRRRLTLAEAERGERPAPFTKEEWKAMAAATELFPGPAMWAEWLAHILNIDDEDDA